MIFVDREGVRCCVENIPDDPRLLQELLEHKIDVTLAEFIAPNKLDTASWIWKNLGGDLDRK